MAVGRTEANATSPRATRGTSTRSAPTAERSHCLQNGKQHDDAHEVAYDARFYGTATAPRSDRGGRRYRGSRVLVALAPATHGYFLRPLRGRRLAALRAALQGASRNELDARTSRHCRVGGGEPILPRGGLPGADLSNLPVLLLDDAARCLNESERAPCSLARAQPTRSPQSCSS